MLRTKNFVLGIATLATLSISGLASADNRIPFECGEILTIKMGGGAIVSQFIPDTRDSGVMAHHLNLRQAVAVKLAEWLRFYANDPNSFQALDLDNNINTVERDYINNAAQLLESPIYYDPNAGYYTLSAQLNEQTGRFNQAFGLIDSLVQMPATGDYTDYTDNYNSDGYAAFDKGVLTPLDLVADVLVTEVGDDRTDPEIWKNHVLIRADIAASMASRLGQIIPSVSSGIIRKDLAAFVTDLTPTYLDMSRTDKAYWDNEDALQRDALSRVQANILKIRNAYLNP